MAGVTDACAFFKSRTCTCVRVILLFSLPASPGRVYNVLAEYARSVAHSVSLVRGDLIVSFTPGVTCASASVTLCMGLGLGSLRSNLSPKSKQASHAASHVLSFIWLACRSYHVISRDL